MKKEMDTIKKGADPFRIEDSQDRRFHTFQSLMRFRIRDVLIVSSLYDFYIFEEGGRLYEILNSEYRGLNLTHTPELTRVSSGREAINLLKTERQRFDMVIATLHIEDMRPAVFALKLRRKGFDLPVVMLAFDNRELAEMLAHKEDAFFDQVFVWEGNYRLLLAMIKHMEDRINVEHDTKILGVQSILVIEDAIRYYSALLPVLYVEVIKQSQRLIREGINLSHKNLRQRARPKILLAKSFEEAEAYYSQFHETILGIISDVDFDKGGKTDSEAGFTFAQTVHARHFDTPILFYSALPENRQKAESLNCRFIDKDNPDIVEALRDFLAGALGFGDFVFRLSDGREVGRASNLLDLEKQLMRIPLESYRFHAERNHFSNWLKARTEFWLAREVKPRKVSDFPSLPEMRDNLIQTLREYRNLQQRGMVTDFDPELFDPHTSISKIGNGSLGGKARGLSFFNMLMNMCQIHNKFDGVRIFVPSAVIVATDVFDAFLDMNNLRRFALEEQDDAKILRHFMMADRFPKFALRNLKAFLELVKTPLAVRSSGLLEDSHVHPFAGVYETRMLPNTGSDTQARLDRLLAAIKQVYASVYFMGTKEYIRATSFRVEDEKMGVIIQVICGSAHGSRFYPVFSGTAQSYNFYPVRPQTSSDGIASVALGLGKMVVEGGTTLRFCPRYPNHIIQISTAELALANNQREFFALDLTGNDTSGTAADEEHVRRYTLMTAEEDGTLDFIGSTYSSDNDVIYDGISRPGLRLVTFAPILKNDLFPLSNILKLLLDLGSWGMGLPVYIEFAADLAGPKSEPHKFSVLQIRPMVLTREVDTVDIEKTDANQLICRSHQVLGNGVLDDLFDIVLVDRSRYDRAKSREVAEEVNRFNQKLLAEKRPYLLIGVGRWGSFDPWLGIPVKWDQISGARIIIETGFADFSVDPSQGSHFLENLNSFSVGYFTVHTARKDCFVDWDWLSTQEPVETQNYTSHLRFSHHILVKMNGRKSSGIIYKPS